MSIPEALPYVQFVAQFALVLGAFFAGYQFLMHRRERSERAALEVLTSLQSEGFRLAYARVWTLPLQAAPEEVQGQEMEDAVETAIGWVDPPHGARSGRTLY